MQKFIILLAFLFGSMVHSQSSYFVSPTGDNGWEGSKKQPWKTIQFGLNQLFPGDTLNIIKGVYNEKLELAKSGTSEMEITIKSYNGEVIIDATAIKSQNAILKIKNQSFINITGIEFVNNIQNFAAGISIEGSGTNITIENCTIRDIHFSDNPSKKATPRRNAQGIIVYGNNEEPLKNIFLKNNRLYNCRLGYSEGLAVNGNVDGFEITGNQVYDLTNIGIDVIGHEGVCPIPEKDQARNGLVMGNTVYHCISSYATSAGIYIDGGKNVSVLNNTVYNNGYGIEVGCENKGKQTAAITVRNNVIYNNEIAGLAIGGFDLKKTGIVTNSTFYNNTLYKNTNGKKGISEILLTAAEDCKLFNNVVFTDDKSNAVISVYPNKNIALDFNAYYSQSGEGNLKFTWEDNYYENFRFYKQASGQDYNSIIGNPQFRSEEGDKFNFSLKPNSMLIDSGNPNHTILENEKDFKNMPRKTDGRIDIGAFEYNGQE
ncbi:MAG: hypothetical protein CSA39_06400 [Flavobacteriales bacterium]|nr:MAG: hypothetical protein CSA39_06400 [Flavobacteriales bacterium]